MQGRKLASILALFLLFAPFLCELHGQRSAAYYLESDHHRALELFDKEKYAAAQEAFDRVIETHGPNDLLRIAAEYYSARCAMELYNQDAEEKMENFVQEHPDSPWLTEAYLELGLYYYQKHRHDKAITAFSKVDTGELAQRKRYELSFKKGHSYFKEEAFDQASRSFYRIKDQEHAYKGPATYYYAHIAYRKKNYKTALDHFKRIEDHPNFKTIVPYYLTQIHYELENYERIIEMAPPFLDSAGTERPNEIARIIGEAFYKTERYEEALPYLQQYIDNSYGVNREDRYQIGFAHMKAGKPEKALEHLEKVVTQDDSLGQIAYYHMGKLYVKKGEKRRAQSAFRSASRIDRNDKIREDALFKFAKLSYELSYDPFDQAIDALNSYIKEYPESDRKEEALKLLSELYMSSRDLDAALKSMERIEDKGLRIRTAYQIVAFDKAVNLYLSDRYNKAIEFFEKARIYPMDRELTTKSLYWQAQCNAELGRSQKALQMYREFRRKPGAFDLPYYHRSYYDAGYVLFRDSAYKDAATEFRKFTDAVPKEARAKEVADAYQRTGDAYYLIKDYKRAVRFYKKGVAIENGKARDRGLYQLAVCKGLMGDLEGKIEVLQRLLDEMPNSEFGPQAKLELGRALVRTKEKDRALQVFRGVIEANPESFEAQKARLQAGLILYQKGKDQKALSRLKEVVSSKAGYELSKEALNRIRDIHVETGTMKKYNQYVAELEGFEIDEDEMEEANYRSAENLFTKGNYEKAAEAFKDYLKKFDSPKHGINARFYRSQALLRSGDSSEALSSFREVVKKGPNRFTLPALEEASTLAHSLDSLETAVTLYKRLEEKSNSGGKTLKALVGQMRCNDELGRDSASAKVAEKVLEHPELTDKERVEALMIKGEQLMADGALEQARSVFRKVVDTTSSIAKAKARYRIAESHLKEGDPQKSEKVIYELVHQKPSYKEWVAKGFILLSDAYREMGDLFQAKETLKSLIGSYDGEQLVKKAEKKLERIKKEIKEKEKQSEKDTGRKSLEIETDSLEDR